MGVMEIIRAITLIERMFDDIPSVIISVTAAPKSILQGCELRYGPLGVHRVCLGCFESDSQKIIFDP